MRGKIKEEYWYVLVMSNEGPIFVTKVGEKKTAYWNKDEKPLEMYDERAKQMALGLTVNGNTAVAVCNPYKIDYQPYNYKYYEIKFEEKQRDEK